MDDLQKLLSEITPGPWALTSMNTQTLVHVGDERIARAFTRIGSANAQLIALAPELASEVLRLRESLKRIRRFSTKAGMPIVLLQKVGEEARAALTQSEKQI